MVEQINWLHYEDKVQSLGSTAEQINWKITGHQNLSVPSVNEKLAIKSAKIILSDFKSATILQACMRSATLTNFLCGVYVQCIVYRGLICNFSP